MKKKLLLVLLSALLVLTLALSLTACKDCDHNFYMGTCTKCGAKDPDYKPSEPPAKVELSTDIPASADSPTLMLHYFRKNDNYTNWDYWIWLDGAAGHGIEIAYKDDFGSVALCRLADIGATEIDTIGIIPRMGGDAWSSKDCNNDRFLDLSTLEMDTNNYLHIYLTQGDPNLYKHPDDIKYTVTAAFSDETHISVTANMAIKTVTVKQDEEQFFEADGKSGLKVSAAVPSDKTIDLSKAYTVTVSYVDDAKTVTVPVSIVKLYGTDNFNKLYYYNGEDLGAVYNPTYTMFKVWSPVSTKIMLNIYNSGNEAEEPRTEQMQKADKGVFELQVSGDLQGKYYTYTVYNSTFPNGKEIVDPYAKSAGLNGVRGMIVNFEDESVVPEGWADVKVNDYDRKELVVWETHVADVTSSATWNGNPDHAKKFLGMIETGTTYTKDEITVSTGFDHIKELGVNAVQLVPIFDQANDESNVKFNWGYNPLNYNVLEGAYSTNPADGSVRIKEFKQLVQAYNNAGINIIMDVVYNHVNSASNSNFDVLMPGYYFRYDGSGNLSNGSGCGNETASDHLMFRKFMIDSVCFWAKEYKLGGFRFDLMALHDIETMNQLVAALKEINPNIVVYGEPWTGGTSALASNVQASQSNGAKFVGYGQFNDQMRDALIKGGMKGVKETGWITNAKKVVSADLNTVISGMKGITNMMIQEPDKTVNYVTCHDNYTLYDRIEAAGITDEATIKKMAMLANSVVLTSNGTTFMLAGEEFLRTKDGDHNSYQSSYEVNELNYELKVDNYDMFQNYQKLIEFKISCGGLHLSKEQIEGNYTVTTLADGSAIKLEIVDGDKTYVVIHANGTVSNLTVDLTGYTLYLDTLNSNVVLSDATAISAYQTLIAYK